MPKNNCRDADQEDSAAKCNRDVYLGEGKYILKQWIEYSYRYDEPIWSTIDVALLLINNRGEASTLISAVLTTRNLALLMKSALILAHKGQLFAAAAAESSNNTFKIFIKYAKAEQKRQYIVMRSCMNNLIVELCDICSTLRLYGEQNYSVSRELLFTGCKEMSLGKRRIAKFELLLCNYIDHILIYAKLKDF